MWQRIQTLYLAVAMALMAVMFWHLEFVWWTALLAVASFMQLVALLAYKFRLFQMRTAVIAAIMLIGLQAWMTVVYLASEDVSSFDMTAVFPAVAAILDVLAARAILSDEMMVRSSSRLRSSKRKH